MSRSPAGGPATVLRLRPRVVATPTEAGIHVRGWATAFTVSGGRDLWTLWQRLTPALSTGLAVEVLDELGARPGPWRAAGRLVAALRTHDLLVPGPPADGDRPDADGPTAWLDDVAARPDRARALLAAAGTTITGRGPVADAAAATVIASGHAPTARARGRDPRLVVLRAGGGAMPAVTVVAAAGSARGFVTDPAMRTPVASGARLADRLGIAEVGPSAPPSAWASVLAAVVGAAAVHRLMCAITGSSPNPRGVHTAPGEDLPGPVWPTVLVASADPLSVTHHPWVQDRSGRAGPAFGTDAARSPGRWLWALDALCDERLGVLPTSSAGSLPQTPTGLAWCATSLGAGTSPATARLDAAVRAAERRLDPGGRLAVGLSVEHADGVLLRRVVYGMFGHAAGPPGAAGAVGGGVGGDRWRSDPHARRWWSTLTVRFGVPARCTVTPVSTDVHLAVVDLVDASGVRGDRLAWSVEATGSAAARSALFLAVARHQASRAGQPPDDAPLTLCGAAVWSPARRPADNDDATERLLQQSLRRLVPTSAHPGPVRTAPEPALFAGLAGCGFVVRGQGGRT